MEGKMVATDAGKRRESRHTPEESVIDRWTYLPPYTLIGLMLFVGFLSFIFDSRSVVQPANQDVVRQIIASRQSLAAPVSSSPENRTWWWVGGAILMPGTAGAFLLRVFRKRKKETGPTEFARMGEPRRAIILRKPDFAQPVERAEASPPAMPNLRPRNMSAQALAISQQLLQRKRQIERSSVQRASIPTASPSSAPPKARLQESRTVSTSAQSDIFKLVFGQNWEPDGEKVLAKRGRAGIFTRAEKQKPTTEQMPPSPVEEEIPFRPLGIA